MKKQKGITLIALVITIIVMLILVGVSVTVALNGGLFSTAKEAADGTQIAVDAEKTLDNGRVKVDGVWYDSIEDYINKKPSENQTEGTTEEEPEVVLPEGWTVAETKPEGWSNNVTAVTDGTNVIPLPNGFEISSEDGESSVSTGLVLKDGANEFVWVPVTDSASYAEDSFGPITDADLGTSTYVTDSQENLNYYYGTDYYNYADFDYATDKTNVETSIQTYGGFYVGRYETTIEGSTIGVQQGKTVLTTNTLLKEGTNVTSGENYYYRWWGLYEAQKDMYVNNSSVGSLMISSKQWDEIMTFTGYSSAKREADTYTTTPDLSGSAYSTDSNAYDVSKNIYDLAGNVYEFTLKENRNRFIRGGGYSNSGLAASWSGSLEPYRSQANYRF